MWKAAKGFIVCIYIYIKTVLVTNNIYHQIWKLNKLNQNVQLTKDLFLLKRTHFISVPHPIFRNNHITIKCELMRHFKLSPFPPVCIIFFRAGMYWNWQEISNNFEKIKTRILLYICPTY